MVEVLVGSSTSRSKKIYPSNTSIRNILEDNDIAYASSQIMLDGMAIQADGMDKTLDDYNIAEKCILVSAIKSNNA